MIPRNQKRKVYPTDLTDKQWSHIEPLIPPAKEGGRPRTTDIREILNAVIYVAKSGCDWRMLPHDFPECHLHRNGDDDLAQSRAGTRRQRLQHLLLQSGSWAREYFPRVPQS